MTASSNYIKVISRAELHKSLQTIETQVMNTGTVGLNGTVRVGVLEHSIYPVTIFRYANTLGGESSLSGSLEGRTFTARTSGLGAVNQNQNNENRVQTYLPVTWQSTRRGGGVSSATNLNEHFVTQIPTGTGASGSISEEEYLKSQQRRKF